jgi:hypothetical protein
MITDNQRPEILSRLPWLGPSCKAHYPIQPSRWGRGEASPAVWFLINLSFPHMVWSYSAVPYSLDIGREEEKSQGGCGADSGALVACSAHSWSYLPGAASAWKHLLSAATISKLALDSSGNPGCLNPDHTSPSCKQACPFEGTTLAKPGASSP